MCKVLKTQGRGFNWLHRGRPGLQVGEGRIPDVAGLVLIVNFAVFSRIQHF